MQKKTLQYLVLSIISITLLICIITYFKPLSFSDVINENDQISAVLYIFHISDGKPNIESIVYDNITSKQKDAILGLLENYNYQRTFKTLFSDGAIHDIDGKQLTLHIYNDNTTVTSISFASPNQITINDQYYNIKNAEQLINQIREILMQPHQN